MGKLGGSAAQVDGETAGSSVRVLVADDNPMVVMAVRSLLRVCGCHADAATCGSSALTRALAGPYDLLILDVHMPGMDGPEVVLSLRAAMGAAAMPHVVAMSADDTPETRAVCRRAGMAEFIPKPVRLTDLERLIRSRKAAGAEGRISGPGVPGVPGFSPSPRA